MNRAWPFKTFDHLIWQGCFCCKRKTTTELLHDHYVRHITQQRVTAHHTPHQPARQLQRLSTQHTTKPTAKRDGKILQLRRTIRSNRVGGNVVAFSDIKCSVTDQKAAGHETTTTQPLRETHVAATHTSTHSRQPADTATSFSNNY